MESLEDEDCKNASIQAPLVEISEPDDPMMTYRPPTISEMKESMTHLPDPIDMGACFAEDLLIFGQKFNPTMRELCRLLTVKMGATHWHKVSMEGGNGQERREHPNWNHHQNQHYRATLTKLCNAIKNEPTNRGHAAGIWESHLRNSFLNGPRADIMTSVKSTFINTLNSREATVYPEL